MPTPSHPRWGRLIGSYPLSDVNESTLSVDSEVAGLRAMKEISGLATEAQAPSQTDLEQHSNIKISILQLALRLSQDPMKIHHLADPPVVSGCIRLMKVIIGRTPGVASPFSYEFGYLCFRLLVVTLNACLLDRWGRLDDALARREQLPRAAAHVLISIEASSAVHKQFENLVNGGDCDPVLEIETLLGILWDDRKLFLRALMLDAPIASGLSGLLFLFARRVAQESDSKENPSPLRKMLYELALRYYLVQDDSQFGPTLNVISSNPCYGDWIYKAKHVDANDSRWIMTAFINRLSRRSDPEHPTMEDASMMLRYVPLATDAQTQDLLPEVVKLVIEHGWLVLLARDNNDEIRLLTRIIDAIRKGDLLDWMAFAMYKLDPTPAAFGERSVQAMSGFFGTLAKTVPRSELERAFQDYSPDWRKFYRHLKATGSSINIPCRQYYSTCLDIWYQIAQSLGLERALHKYDLIDCFNGRCPRAYTNDADGPRTMCAGCKNAVYCSDQCQSM
ncbi:hypothetical protein RSAG8_12136, partial [Rhizoctonia solani AG-8 WAC10335]